MRLSPLLSSGHLAGRWLVLAVTLSAAASPTLLPGLTPAQAAVTAVSGAAEVRPVGVWPLRPRPQVVHRFDPPATPYGPGHRGVDLAGHPGQAVHAAMAGRIAFSGRLAGRGVVVVDHGPTRTTYEPVDSARRVGEEVTRGAVIGSLGLVGSHCFPAACLHWGWLRGEQYLDPLALVGALPVRLLPWGGLPGRFASAEQSPPAPATRAAPATMGRWRAHPGPTATRSRDQPEAGPAGAVGGRWWLAPRAPPW